MSSSRRRFEILLPLRSNEGQPFPDELFGLTAQELREHFGGVSTETQVIRGLWQQEGQLFRDESLRVFVDVADTAENREFFVKYKEVLKERFQ
jgi:hypothetical protein